MKPASKKVYTYHIKKALDYIYQNYEKPLTLEDMAKYLGLNKCYFCKLFRMETGKTFSQFLNELRVKKSKELLLNTNLSILDVALAVGYNNQNYYNMSFKKLTGTTPLKYRKYNGCCQ